MARLPLDDGTRPFDLGLAAVRAQQLRSVTNRRERIAQLVREHREELVLALIHFLQRFFGLTARSDIETDPDDVPMPRMLDEAGLVIDPSQAASGMPIAILDFASTGGNAFFQHRQHDGELLRIDVPLPLIREHGLVSAVRPRMSLHSAEKHARRVSGSQSHVPICATPCASRRRSSFIVTRRPARAFASAGHTMSATLRTRSTSAAVQSRASALTADSTATSAPPRAMARTRWRAYPVRVPAPQRVSAAR